MIADIEAITGLSSFTVDPPDGASPITETGGMDFELVGEISDVETFATGASIRELPRLRRVYGAGRWRKQKGTARIRLADGGDCRAELHWYEAHGIGRKN